MGYVATVRTILVFVGGFPLILLFMARIDSYWDLWKFRVTDVVVGLALLIAFALRDAEKETPRRRWNTYFGAVLIWIGLSGSLLAWHEHQVYLRTVVAPTQFTRHVISQTYEALTSFSKDCGTFPSETQGLNALSVDPGLKEWDGPYISESRYLDDVWQHRLQYALRGADPLVWSCGPDGISGTKDDVTVAYGDMADPGGS